MRDVHVARKVYTARYSCLALLPSGECSSERRGHRPLLRNDKIKPALELVQSHRNCRCRLHSSVAMVVCNYRRLVGSELEEVCKSLGE